MDNPKKRPQQYLYTQGNERRFIDRLADVRPGETLHQAVNRLVGYMNSIRARTTWYKGAKPQELMERCHELLIALQRRWLDERDAARGQTAVSFQGPVTKDETEE